MATTTRDPRTIITPDAFSVHPPLLGTPLASPSRRGVALLIDIFLVVLITTLTSGVWFILGVVAAAFFFTRARKQGSSDRGAKVFRAFLGCMGVATLSFTAVVFLGIQYMNRATNDFGPLGTVVGGFQEGAQLRATDDPDEAVALAVDIGRRLQTLESADQTEDLLRELIPEDVGGVDGDVILARAIVQLSPLVDPPGDQAGPEVAAPPDPRLAEALELAGDTIGELEQDLARANRDLQDTRAELDEALQRGGLIGWFTSRIDSLGFGLGWWTLYFAILMPWMKGQTPGKRALGVRVVRLDGNPVTWWHAFERAGGYAAGVATGTLGFLQVYWDANRQAIHDKVAGTVVIREGAAKVPGNWELQVTGGTRQPGEAGPA